MNHPSARLPAPESWWVGLTREQFHAAVEDRQLLIQARARGLNLQSWSHPDGAFYGHRREKTAWD
jgi:hypothetical protein